MYVSSRHINISLEKSVEKVLLYLKLNTEQRCHRSGALFFLSLIGFLLQL